MITGNDINTNTDINTLNDNAENECEKFTFASPNKLTREEREVYLNYCEADDCWFAESSIPKYWRKFEKQGWICTSVTHYADGTVCSKSFKSGSRKGVTITNPFKTRVVTDEQRELARQRFQNFHDSKNIEDDEIENED